MHNTEVCEYLSRICSCGCNIVCIAPVLPVSESPSGIYFYRSNNCTPRKVIILYRSSFCSHLHAWRISIGSWYQLPMLIGGVAESAERCHMHSFQPRWQSTLMDTSAPADSKVVFWFLMGRRAIHWQAERVPKSVWPGRQCLPGTALRSPSYSLLYTLII